MRALLYFLGWRVIVIHLLDWEEKMRVYVYSTVQHNEWCNPGALVAVNEFNEVIWFQANPDNTLTRTYFDEDRSPLDITGFQSITLVDIHDE